MRFCAILIMLLWLTATLSATNWPQFRGPTGNGISEAKTVPTTWSETENIRWKVAVHDKGWSSPVVWGDQVWVTTAKEDGKEFFAVSLDRTTGKVLHDLRIFSDPNPDPKVKQYNSFASPTPCLEEGRLYAHFGSHGTACVDTASGKVLWERRDLPCNHFRGPASSPVVYQNWLFLLFDGFDRQYVVCLDKTNGKTVWQKDRDLPYKRTGSAETDGDLKKAFATPSVFEINGKLQLVAPAAMGTIAYDPATGEEIWRVIHGGMNEASRPLLANGLIFVTAGSASTLLAIKSGGTGDLTKSGVAWKIEKSAPGKPSPSSSATCCSSSMIRGLRSAWMPAAGPRSGRSGSKASSVALLSSRPGIFTFPGRTALPSSLPQIGLSTWWRQTSWTRAAWPPRPLRETTCSCGRGHTCTASGPNDAVSRMTDRIYFHRE